MQSLHIRIYMTVLPNKCIMAGTSKFSINAKDAAFMIANLEIVVKTGRYIRYEELFLKRFHYSICITYHLNVKGVVMLSAVIKVFLFLFGFKNPEMRSIHTTHNSRNTIIIQKSIT